MATRKSSAAAAARRAAMERALKFQEREQKLLDLAVDYATADQELTDLAERYEAQIAALRAEQERDEEAARLRVAQAASAMVDLGASKNEAAERLGITRAELNALLRAVSASETDATDDTNSEQPSKPASVNEGGTASEVGDADA